MAAKSESHSHTAAIEEVKTRLDGSVEHLPCRLLQFAQDQIVVLYVLEQERDLHGIRLPKGTRTLAYFWDSDKHQDKPFNVYHFIGGKTLAYYFNIGDQCRIGPDKVFWRDLVVDVIGQPGLSPLVVDEDLLPADLPLTLRKYIAAAKQMILQNYAAIVADVERRSAPFICA